MDIESLDGFRPELSRDCREDRACIMLLSRHDGEALCTACAEALATAILRESKSRLRLEVPCE